MGVRERLVFLVNIILTKIIDFIYLLKILYNFYMTLLVQVVLSHWLDRSLKFIKAAIVIKQNLII